MSRCSKTHACLAHILGRPQRAAEIAGLTESRRKRPGDAEANVVAPAVDALRDPDRGAEKVRSRVPGTAAQDTLVAISTGGTVAKVAYFQPC